LFGCGRSEVKCLGAVPKGALTKQTPTRTRISRKWRKSLWPIQPERKILKNREFATCDQNEKFSKTGKCKIRKQQTKIRKTRIAQKAIKCGSNKKESCQKRKTKSRTKPLEQKRTGEKARKSMPFRKCMGMNATIRKQHATRQLLAVLNRFNIVS